MGEVKNMAGKNERHSFKVFTENLKNNKIHRVILMYGVEQFLVKWAAETLVKKFVNPSTAAMDFITMDENATCSNIIEACETFSMFSERRIVWVKNFKLLGSDNVKGYTSEDIKMLTEYIKNSNESTVLIFSGEDVRTTAALTSVLKKEGQVYNFERLDRRDLTSFIRKRFVKAGIEIKPQALKLFIDLSGYYNRDSEYTLFHFENDIQKVIAHCTGNLVTAEDIEKTISGDMDTFVFDMINGITGNQKDKAFAILYNILSAGTDAFSIIGAIVSQFEFMLSVKELREDGYDLTAIHKKIGGSDYRIKKAIPFVNRFSKNKLKKTLVSIYEVDRQIKTGLLDSRTALELFIAGI